jgi:hypothetical protein
VYFGIDSALLIILQINILILESESNMPTSQTSPTFAIIHPWDINHNSAEKEVSIRMSRAAQNIGIKCLHINNEGYILDETYVATSKHITTIDNLSFIFHHHFSSYKKFDSWNIYPLWNPPSIPFDWHNPQFILDTFLQHDDFVKSTGDFAETHMAAHLASYGRECKNMPLLYPTMPADQFIPPRPLSASSARLFYCGVNWERSANQTPRHNSIFKQMEGLDIIDIYGPRNIGPHPTWQGYECYRGELPFDGGDSLLAAINKSGIALALSSLVHQKAEIMSNRIFESAAAGAVIITDENDFVRDMFGSSVIMIENKGNQQNSFEQISEAYNWIKGNPETAYEMACQSQKIYLENFTLEKHLQNLFDTLPERKNNLAKQLHAQQLDETIDVVAYCPSLDTDVLHDMITSIAKQTYTNVRTILVIDKSLETRTWDIINSTPNLQKKAVVVSIELFLKDSFAPSGYIRCKTTGQMIQHASNYIQSPYLAFLGPQEEWFEDHLTTLKRALENNEQSMISSTLSITHQHSNGHIIGTERPSSYIEDPALIFSDIKCKTRVGTLLIRKTYWQTLCKENILTTLDYIDFMEFFPFVMNAAANQKITSVARTTHATIYHELEEQNIYTPTLQNEDWQGGYIIAYLMGRYGTHLPSQADKRSTDLMKIAQGHKPQIDRMQREMTRLQQFMTARALASGRQVLTAGRTQLEADMEVIGASPYWDELHYMEEYGDTLNGMPPLDHFCSIGVFKGNLPSKIFDPGFYMERYPEVAESGMNALIHFMNIGIHKGYHKIGYKA